MRILEFPNEYINRPLSPGCCFFQVTHDIHFKDKTYFCIVSDDDKNIKHKYKNKSVLIYKNRDIYINHLVKTKLIDRTGYNPNFMGTLDLETCVFNKSRDYTGSISVIETVEFLNESIKSR